MRKKYSSKLAWIGATLCAFLLVACGLKVVDVTLSADEIEQGDEVTVTAKLMRAGGTGEIIPVYIFFMQSVFHLIGMMLRLLKFTPMEIMLKIMYLHSKNHRHTALCLNSVIHKKDING